MIREEFLRLLREDEAFREEVRRQILTDRLLELPDRVEENFARAFRLIEENARQVAALTGKMGEFERTQSRFGQVLGVHFEGILGFLRERGFGVPERMWVFRSGSVSGPRGCPRIDGVAEVETPDRRRVWVLAEAAGRVFAEDVRRWAETLSAPDPGPRRSPQDFGGCPWRAALRRGGIGPPWLPWMFGIRPERSAVDEARRARIGLADRAGVLVEPTLWEDDDGRS